jgi:hypothetical protein
MKKIIVLLLLVVSSFSYGQITTVNKLKIKSVYEDLDSFQVLVRNSSSGEVNYINKSYFVNQNIYWDNILNKPSFPSFSNNNNYLPKYYNGSYIDSNISDDGYNINLSKPTTIDSGVLGITGLKFTNSNSLDNVEKVLATNVSSSIIYSFINKEGFLITINNTGKFEKTNLSDNTTTEVLNLNENTVSVVVTDEEIIYAVVTDSQTGLGRIYKITNSFTSSLFSNVSYNSATLNYHKSTGNLYLASGGGVYKVTPSGTSSSIFSDIYIGTIVMDSESNIYAFSGVSGTNSVYKITQSGSSSVFTVLNEATFSPIIDKDDNIYTTDINKDIIKIRPTGEFTVLSNTGVGFYSDVRGYYDNKLILVRGSQLLAYKIEGSVATLWKTLNSNVGSYVTGFTKLNGSRYLRSTDGDTKVSIVNFDIDYSLKVNSNGEVITSNTEGDNSIINTKLDDLIYTKLSATNSTTVINF